MYLLYLRIRKMLQPISTVQKLVLKNFRPHLFLSATYAKSMSSNAAENSVIFEDKGDKGIITLNRPRTLNSLTFEMVQDIYPTLKKWEDQKSFVIIKAAGEKAFCAGGDVVSIIKDIKKGGSLSKHFFKEEYKLNCLIGTYHIPFIALISGITMGGGVGLSVHGQFRIATEKSVFAMPETSIGLIPDVGGSHFLPRLGGNLGNFLALTGHRLKGRDLLKAGIATHACDHAKLQELERTLLDIETPYPENVSQIINEFSKSSTFDKNSEFSLKQVMPKIESCFRGETIEEILSKLEKDGSDWAVKQIEILNKCSPTSLKVTLEQLKRGAHLTLQECLAMEYRLVQRCCENDFPEGVRALLIDKDNSPKWNPAKVSEVSNEMVEKFFSMLPEEDELRF